MLAPNSNNYEDLNNWSAVVKLTFGNNSFLLDGDAEDISEREMIANGYDLKADLLKVGHHGSSSSTTPEFLSKVNPKYAVISVGAGNDYGHPHKTTMQKLQERGISVYRTDQNKTIIATSDGNNITFNTNPGNYNYGEEGSQASSGSGSNVTNQPSNATRTVYYVPTGKSYHYRKDCSTLARSKTILEGPLQDVINAGHADPCDICVK
jgi:competence protein ComEC